MSEGSDARAKVFTDKLLEMYGEARLEQIARAWCQQNRKERQARLRVVIALAVELEAIRKTDYFATSLGEQVIEDVIEGDWKMVADWAEHFTWPEDEARRVRYAPLWAKFVAVLRDEIQRRGMS